MATPLNRKIPDIRPLDRLRSLKTKLAVVVAITVTMSAAITWAGLSLFALGPTRTLPVAIVFSLIFTRILARGMTSPLRQMTAAAQAMAKGDYSVRVRASSKDEVGNLAVAFNTMAEDLQSVDRWRKELVANVSHELRTPVSALRAQLENIVDGVATADPASLKVALAQTERLSKLVANLLDLSRLEAGASELKLSSLSLLDLLTQSAQEGELIAPAKDLTFTVDVTPEKLRFDADRTRIEQIVANLVQNAVRHSPVGGTVTLRGYLKDHSVVIEISDQGPGIAPADRHAVFERFNRGQFSRGQGSGAYSNTGGTGLGLSIVRWAVELHHGEVEVADSQWGCTMRVTLPQRHKKQTR